MCWLETYRGTVHRWEVDNVDHFTVAYYFARFEDATLALAARSGSIGEAGVGMRARVSSATSAICASCGWATSCTSRAA